MKILITTDWYRPVINGVVTSVVNLADGLRRMGHEVRILTLSGSHRTYREGDVYYIGSVGVGAVYPKARLRAAGGGQLIRELTDWRPDVVHSQCEFSTFAFARRIARTCGCPLVHTYHTVYEDLTCYFSPNARLGRSLAVWFSRYVLSQTDAVIVPTDKIRNILGSYGVTRPIYTVPTGIDISSLAVPVSEKRRRQLRSSLGIGEEDIALTYVGRLAKEKHIDELIGFLASAPGNIKLLLVGDGPARRMLEEQADECGLEDRVIFAGMVPPVDVAGFYKAGDIFVSASQCETQGMTYIEAMACGLPVLCRRDECLRGVVCRGINGFAYDSKEQFLAFLEVMVSTDLRHRMGAAAGRLARQRFSEDGFAANALAVYRSCLHAAAVAAA